MYIPAGLKTLCFVRRMCRVGFVRESYVKQNKRNYPVYLRNGEAMLLSEAGIE
jgi:hypothetical protein